MDDYFGNRANQPEHDINEELKELITPLFDGWNGSTDVGAIVGASLITILPQLWHTSFPKAQINANVLDFLRNLVQQAEREIKKREENCDCTWGTIGTFGQPKGKYLCLGCRKVHDEYIKQDRIRIPINER